MHRKLDIFLVQIEGPVSPAELVEILQKTMEEQGLAFGSARAKEEEKRRANQRLREEQDAAYFAALHIDQVHLSTHYGMPYFQLNCSIYQFDYFS